MTAAHCLYQLSPDAVKIVAGDHVTTTVQESERVYYPLRFLLHEDYDHDTLHNDIALIELTEEIQYNDTISPVCLPTSLPHAGAISTTTGWGLTLRTGDKTHLNELHVPIVAHTVCSSPRYWGDYVTADMVCAGYHRHSVCRGDSGGPLVYNNNGNSPYSLIGVTSFVAKHCRTGGGTKPSVFTSVYTYLDWIGNNTAKEELNCTGYIASDDGHCYKYVANPMTYTEAREFCTAQGSHLIEIANQKEQYFLEGLIRGAQRSQTRFRRGFYEPVALFKNFMPRFSDIWIGLQNGQYYNWNTGATIVFSNWKHGDSVISGAPVCGGTSNYGKWSYFPCNNKRPFVCERSPLHNPNTLKCDVHCSMTKARNCYRYHRKQATYARAQEICREQGGHLAEISNEWEEYFLQGLIGDSYVWTGLRGSNNNWVRESGSVWASDSDWQNGRPSTYEEHCAAFHNNQWHDFPCNSRKEFVCENSQNGIPDILTCNCGIGVVMGTTKVRHLESTDILCLTSD